MNSLLAAIDSSRRWSPKTRDVYRSAMTRFLAFASGDLTGVAVERWRDELLSDGLAPVTVHKLVAGVKAVAKRHAALTGGADFARAAELPATDQWTPHSPPKVSDVRGLLTAAERDRSPLGLRDRPALRLMAIAAGERRGEIESHRIGDLQGSTLSIRRKGNWVQVVALDQNTLNALHEWLEWRGGSVGEPMFVALGRTVADRWELRGPLTGAAIARLLRRRCRQAGLRLIRPHDLRRFFISALLDSGARPHEVMLAAGHKSLGTTSRYVGSITDTTQPAADRITSALLARKEIP
jgi:integrase